MIFMQPNALLQACLLACFEVPSIQAPHPHGVEQGAPPLSRVWCVNTSVPGAASLGPGAVPLSTSLRGPEFWLPTEGVSQKFGRCWMGPLGRAPPPQYHPQLGLDGSLLWGCLSHRILRQAWL